MSEQQEGFIPNHFVCDLINADQFAQDMKQFGNTAPLYVEHYGPVVRIFVPDDDVARNVFSRFLKDQVIGGITDEMVSKRKISEISFDNNKYKIVYFRSDRGFVEAMTRSGIITPEQENDLQTQAFIDGFVTKHSGKARIQ
jgi:hypothetical protein